jgi:hypothetical protein
MVDHTVSQSNSRASTVYVCFALENMAMASPTVEIRFGSHAVFDNLSWQG